MKRLFATLFILMLTIACESKRPDSNGVFTVTLDGRSILKEAAVTVLKDGTTEEVATGTTDETGAFTIEKIATANTLRVRVCGGTFFSIGTGADVSFNGCLESVVLVKETGKEKVFVDLVSMIAAAYESDTAKDEVLAYLDLTADSAATEETTLTDATKRYLWQQAISVVAAQIANANGVTPESSLSTEVLFGLMLADLIDNNTIDGSTKTKFGPVLPVNEALVRQLLSNALAGVSANFKEADLADWAEHLQTAEAKFLGEGGEDTDDPIQNDTDETGDPDEEALYPDYDTVGNPPGIEITTPANNAVLYGTVTVRAQRTLDSCPLLSLTCILKNGDSSFSKELTDTNTNEEVLEAAVDTLDLELADEQFTLTCTGSNGIKQAVKSVKFTLSNKNPVQVLVYVTDKVTAVESVDVFDAEGKKFKTLTETAGEIAGDLPPGEYTVTVNGGDYTSALFVDGLGEPKVVTLSVPLLSRAVIEAGATTKIYVTPLTTIREIIYQGLKKKGGRTESEAIDDSLALFEVHYIQDINPYVRPQAGQPAENATVNWAAIAALEQLAGDIAESEGLSEGAILMDDILATLGSDLIETTALFDGLDITEDQLKIKTSVIDSYLFRYHYAVALKRFIETTTEYTYQDFQNLIYNIAMDESELFPEEDAPIEVVAQAPEVKNIAFKRNGDAAFVDYADPDAIPFVKDSLDLRFDVELASTAAIDTLDLYFVEAEPLKQLDDLLVTGSTYTAEGIVVTGDDGEKALTIDAVDDQGNYGLKTMKIVKDSTAPTVEVTPPVAEVISGTLSFDFTVTEENLAEEHYTILPAGGSATEYPYATPVLSGSIALSEIPADGTYTVTFTAIDKAGNSGENAFTRTIDTTAPSVGYNYSPAPNADGFIAQTGLTVTMTAIDRTGATLTYKTSQDGGANWSDSVNNVSVLDLDDQTAHDLRFKVADDVNNTSTEEVKAVTVDTVTPKICVDYNAASEFVGNSINYKLTEKYPKTFELTLNDVKWGDLNSDNLPHAIDMNPWQDGRYHFVFTATDKAGNAYEKSSSAECQALDFYKTLDRTAPTATKELLTQNNNTPIPNMEWAKDDDIKIVFSNVADPNRTGTINFTYHYILDSGEEQIAGPTTQTSRNIFLDDQTETLESDYPGTQHSIKAWVEDESNNASAALELVFYVDSIVPTLTVTDPLPGAVSSRQYTYNAADSNLKIVYYTMNAGAAVQLDVSSGNDQQVTFACGSNGITDGTYNFNFYAEDYAGNIAGPVARSVLFDCTPPVFNGGTDPFLGTMLENNDTYLKNDMGSVALTLSEPGTVSYTLTLGGIDQECTGDLSYSGSGTVTVACPFATGGVDDGVYTLILSATDTAGNKSTEYRRTFTIDTIVPDLFMTGSKTNPWNFRLEPAGTTVLSHVQTEINFSHCNYRLNIYDVAVIMPSHIMLDPATDAYPENDAYQIELRLYLKGFVNDTYFLQDALNTVTATCYDLSGNSTTKQFTWQYDVTAPTVGLTVEPVSQTGTINQTFNFDANDEQYGDTNISKVEYRYKTNTTAYTAWSNLSINGSAGGAVVFPAVGDTALNDANFWKNSNKTVTLELRTTDKAYNVSDSAVYQWIVDKWAPVLWDDGGMTLCLPPTFQCYKHMYFTPWEVATAASIRVDGVVQTSPNGSCAIDASDGGVNCYMKVDGADHVVQVAATDEYGNTGEWSDCQAAPYMCVQRNVYFSNPALTVTVKTLTSTQLIFNVATDGDSTIQSCKIYNSSNVLKYTCANSTGDQTVNISNTGTWPAGDYRIEVVSKNTTSGNTTTQNTNFTIDRTATSFTITHVGAHTTYYANAKPILHYSATIAYGVKNVKVALYGRTVNINYPHSGYSCVGSLCTGSYEATIYNGAGSAVDFIAPMPDGGIFDTIKYTITSTKDVTASGTVALSPVIRYMKTASEKTRVTGYADEAGKLVVNHAMGIIASSVTTSMSAPEPYTDMCKVNNVFHFHKKRNTHLVTKSDSTGKVTLNKAVATYNFGGSQAAARPSARCNMDVECPINYGEASCREVGNIYDGKWCWPNAGYYSATIPPEILNFLRDAVYYPRDITVTVTDNWSIATTYNVNDTPYEKTADEMCPQYGTAQ